MQQKRSPSLGVSQLNSCLSVWLFLQEEETDDKDEAEEDAEEKEIEDEAKPEMKKKVQCRSSSLFTPLRV